MLGIPDRLELKFAFDSWRQFVSSERIERARLAHEQASASNQWHRERTHRSITTRRNMRVQGQVFSAWRDWARTTRKVERLG